MKTGNAMIDMYGDEDPEPDYCEHEDYDVVGLWDIDTGEYSTTDRGAHLVLQVKCTDCGEYGYVTYTPRLKDPFGKIILEKEVDWE